MNEATQVPRFTERLRRIRGNWWVYSFGMTSLLIVLGYDVAGIPRVYSASIKGSKSLILCAYMNNDT
jgi:hypothetical protein